jgi:hypothetical protein
MNRRRLARLERELASAQDRLMIPRTEEGLRELFRQCLPELTAKALGPDDSCSVVEYLRGLSLQEMMALYEEAMDTMTEQALRNPDATRGGFSRCWRAAEATPPARPSPRRKGGHHQAAIRTRGFPAILGDPLFRPSFRSSFPFLVPPLRK